MTELYCPDKSISSIARVRTPETKDSRDKSGIISRILLSGLTTSFWKALNRIKDTVTIKILNVEIIGKGIRTLSWGYLGVAQKERL